jgi:hypothetical protein
MRARLILLLESWAEREAIRVFGRGLRIPDAMYVWIKDALGHYHYGSYDPWGRFMPLQAAFTLIPGTAKPEGTALDEFGCAFRELAELEQGVIIVAHFGRGDEWSEHLGRIGLSNRRAERLLAAAWYNLMVGCKRRGLLGCR